MTYFNLDDLKNLEGCRVIEGSLKIVRINDVTEKSFENISFPDLREITGSLVIYGVSGLKSIGNLFPNLVRIHGNELVLSYAFILFENPDLEYVGLSNFKSIAKGAVKIENNAMLCYVNTVNWSMIVHDDFIEHNLIKVSFPI